MDIQTCDNYDWTFRAEHKADISTQHNVPIISNACQQWCQPVRLTFTVSIEKHNNISRCISCTVRPCSNQTNTLRIAMQLHFPFELLHIVIELRLQILYKPTKTYHIL